MDVELLTEDQVHALIKHVFRAYEGVPGEYRLESNKKGIWQMLIHARCSDESDLDEEDKWYAIHLGRGRLEILRELIKEEERYDQGAWEAEIELENGHELHRFVNDDTGYVEYAIYDPAKQRYTFLWSPRRRAPQQVLDDIKYGQVVKNKELLTLAVEDYKVAVQAGTKRGKVRSLLYIEAEMHVSPDPYRQLLTKKDFEEAGF